MDLSEQPQGSFLRHPWEMARAEFFLGELARAGLLRAGTRFLDVGSGDAWLAGQVLAREPAVHMTCWDLGYEAATPDCASGIELTHVAPDGPFDVCLALDVAEHVEDDRSFLRDVSSRLAHGGALLFSVPAWQSLYTEHDRALRHFRRYDPAEARALLGETELEIVRSGGLFHSLLAPRALQKLRESFSRREDTPPPPPALVWRGGARSQRVVLGALTLDRVMTSAAATLGVSLPGLSWWALCRRSR